MNRFPTSTSNVFRPMNRNVLLLLTVLMAACGDKAPTVSVFTSAPGTIAKGSSATLVFGAEGAEKLSLDPGVGDVTGKTEAVVTPAETTVYTLTASNGSAKATKTVTVTVGPTPAAGFKLAASGPLTAGTPGDITVTAVDPSGATVPSYAGTVHLMSNDAAAELPADFTFTAADKGVKTVPVTFHMAGARQLVASGTVGGGMQGTFSSTSEPFTVKAGLAHEMRLASVPAEVESGAELSFQVSFVDAFGNAAPEYATQLNVQHSDDSAPAVPDVTITDTDHGTATIRLTFFKAGVQTVTVQDTHHDTVKAQAEVRVRPSTAASYVISGLPSAANVGEALPVVVTALDARGNRAHGYSGTMRISSTDPSLKPPADATFTQGVATVSVAFLTDGNQTVTATEVGGSLKVTSNEVTVTSSFDEVVRIFISAGPAVAGSPITVTAKAQDSYGNTVDKYRGTVKFTSTDALAVFPDSYTFTESDAGAHTFTATFKTPGTQGLSGVDTARPGLSGSGAFAVSPGDAVGCEVSGVPATTTAGTALAVRVTVRDALGNAVTGYSGTVSVTSTDLNPAASMPDAAAYVPAGDQGSRVFNAKLVTAGGQTLTAADTTGAWSCKADVTLTPAAPLIQVALPTDANAGDPVNALVSVKDTYGNPISYTGTLAFTSTDPSAALPGDLTLAGTESGTATVSATFNTLGAQQLKASLVGDTTLSGTGATAVHGFVYTDPTAGMGKVRLVLNKAASSASTVQLDLVSNTTILASASGSNVRGGIYSAGMNLPLDNTRVEAAPTLLVEGNAFNLGSAPKAVAAALPMTGATAGVFYTGVSQKFDGAGKATGDVSVIPGRVFYSVRLKLPAKAAVGTVFDGVSLDKRFRAAVRNRGGDEVLSNPDFALGKLEVR